MKAKKQPGRSRRPSGAAPQRAHAAAPAPTPTPRARRSSRWDEWLAPMAVALLTVVAFFPSLQNGFVDFDDDQALLLNPRYRGLGWANVRWMFTTLHMGHYQPLSWLTLGFDHLLWGMAPWGYHLTNL